MGNKDYYNSNKSYSTNNYHNGESKESNVGLILFICSITILTIISFLLLDKNSREEIKNGALKAFQGNKQEQPQRTNPKPSGPAIKVSNSTSNRVSNSTSTSTTSSFPDNAIKNMNIPESVYKTNETDKSDKTQKRAGYLPNRVLYEENKSKEEKDTNISDYNRKQARIKELLIKINKLSNEYKEKIIELNNTPAKYSEMKQKEFKKYEVIFKKEISRLTKELEQVRRQKVNIPTQKETGSIAPVNRRPIVKKTDYEEQKLKQMRDEVYAMRREFYKRLPKLSELPEKELIEEYDISQSIKEEKLKNYNVDENNIYSEEFNLEISFFMQIALKKDYPELLKKIINQGYSINNWGFNGFPTLFYANECNSQKCLEILLNNPEADLTRELRLLRKEFREGKERKLKEEGWYEGKNLLHSAAQSGNISLAKKLLEIGISINKRTKDGKTPLYFAVKYQHPEMVAFLIENKVEIDDYLEDLTNNREILDYLKTDIKTQAKPTSNNALTAEDKEWQEAYEYIKEGKLVKLFDIYKQKDLSKMSFRGEPAPCIAAQYDRTEIMKFLIHEYDCKNLVDSRNNRNALHYAAMNSSHNTIDLLMKNGFNPNSQDKNQNTALHLAINNVSVKPLNILVKTGANINALNKYKQTPLILATKRSNYLAMEALLKFGADFDIEDSEGKTALDYAVENSSELFIDYLLLFGANPNHLNSKKQNLLHIAILNDDVAAVKLLLAKGANMNQQDSNGNTPLHYLAQFASNNNEMLNIFKEYQDNFDLTIKNSDGKTPSNISEIDCFAKN